MNAGAGETGSDVLTPFCDLTLLTPFPRFPTFDLIASAGFDWEDVRNYLLQDSSYNESLIIPWGMAILMGSDRVAEVVDKLAGARFAVSELPDEPLSIEVIVVHASRLSDSIRVE